MICLTYILLPFALISFGLVHKGQHVFLILSSIIIMASAVRSWPLRVFGIYAAGWFLFLRVGDMAGIVTRQQAMGAMNGTIFMIVAFAIYLSVSVTNIKKEHIFNAICIGAILQSVLGFIQAFNFYPVIWFVGKITNIDNPLAGAITGSLGNPNFLGAYLAISLPFFFRKKWIWLVILPVYHLLTLHSSGAAVAALAVIVVYFKQWKVLIAAAIVGILFLVMLEDASVIKNPRWDFWWTTIQKICASPRTFIVGYGPGYPTGYNFPIHNEWLELWFNYGAVSIFMAALYIKNIYRGDKILLAAFAAFIVNSLANYGWHLAPTGFLILIVLGLLEKEKHGGLSNICRHYHGSPAGS